MIESQGHPWLFCFTNLQNEVMRCGVKMWGEEEDTTMYKVVVNHEEQYSIWPVDRENPLGWHDAGKSGAKAECLAYIEEVWTDMRPLSLRKKMEEDARNAGCGSAGSGE